MVFFLDRLNNIHSGERPRVLALFIRLFIARTREYEFQTEGRTSWPNPGIYHGGRPSSS
jgi:hypothetical protein